VGAADGLEGGELACAGKGLVHLGDVLRAAPGRVRGVDHKAVVHPSHDLLLAAHDAAEPQPVACQAPLLRLAQRPRAELLDVRGAHVRDRAQPARKHAGLESGLLARELLDCEGDGGEREEEEWQREGPRHGCRIGKRMSEGEGFACLDWGTYGTIGFRRREQSVGRRDATRVWRRTWSRRGTR
jgi:hypothetical protein